jgi:hypothetical protein
MLCLVSVGLMWCVPVGCSWSARCVNALTGFRSGQVECDALIECTGYRMRLPFLPAPLMDGVFFADHDYISLYRNCLHPRWPSLFFIGFIESFGNVPQISALLARSLSRSLSLSLSRPAVIDACVMVPGGQPRC